MRLGDGDIGEIETLALSNSAARCSRRRLNVKTRLRLTSKVHVSRVVALRIRGKSSSQPTRIVL